MQALIINLEKDIDRYYKLEKKCKKLTNNLRIEKI